MPCKIKNPANIELGELEDHVQDLFTHVHNKVGFNKPPTMVFDSDPSNEAKILGKTAYYDPNTIQIHIYTDGRHPKDMLRSIAHELIHHWQNEEGRLNVGGYSGPGYYLKNKGLKDLEDEAMKLGNGYFREFEDNRKLKENKNMSLKEWKNNELSRLLMERFGINKENHKGTPGMGNPTPKDEPNPFDYERKGEVGGRVFEDSRDAETFNYEKNKDADKKRLNKDKLSSGHRDALEKDVDYDEEHEELEETVSGRHDPRNRRDDDPRLRPMEEDVGMADEDDLLTDKEAEDSSKEDSEGVANESLKETMRRILKKNKKLRLRFK